MTSPVVEPSCQRRGGFHSQRSGRSPPVQRLTPCTTPSTWSSRQSAGAPLRSGFVQNIKANGPTIYAHEVYVLNGAAPRARYTVTNHFFFDDPACADPANDSPTDTAELRTNRAGNARADVFFVPADVAGFEGVHGVRWTIKNAAGQDVYRTGCSTVTLD